MIEIDKKNGYKVCKCCKNKKNLNDFGIGNKKMETYIWYGYNKVCKLCQAKQARKNYVKSNRKPQFDIDTKRGWKMCNQCHEKLSLKHFLIDKRFNLYVTQCNSCDYANTKIYRKNNKEKVYANAARYRKEQMKNNHQYREKTLNSKKRYYRNNIVSTRMAGAIKEALRKNKAGRHWETLVDYTKEELKRHLESKFVEGMSWQRFIDGEIEIDHIIPKELFNFKTDKDKQFKICWSLNNLQPLWSRDNESKSDFLPDGRKARNLTPKEKLDYLKSLGYDV